MAHLIHGYLGAGKTTFAMRLEQENGAVRFSHDAWMVHLFGEDPPAETFGVRREQVWTLMEDVWMRCLVLGLDVVLDMGFWRRRDRDRARAQIAGLGASYRLYELACDDAEAWRRIERRNTNLDGSLFIARPTFEALRAGLEPLGEDEDRVTIDTTMWTAGQN